MTQNLIYLKLSIKQRFKEEIKERTEIVFSLREIAPLVEALNQSENFRKLASIFEDAISSNELKERSISAIFAEVRKFIKELEKIESQQKCLTEFLEKKNSLEALLKEKEEELSKIEDRKNELKKEMEALEFPKDFEDEDYITKLKNYQKKISHFTNEMENLNNLQITFNADIGNLRNNKQTIESNIKQIQADVDSKLKQLMTTDFSISIFLSPLIQSEEEKNREIISTTTSDVSKVIHDYEEVKDETKQRLSRHILINVYQLVRALVVAGYIDTTKVNEESIKEEIKNILKNETLIQLNESLQKIIATFFTSKGLTLEAIDKVENNSLYNVCLNANNYFRQALISVIEQNQNLKKEIESIADFVDFVTLCMITEDILTVLKGGRYLKRDVSVFLMEYKELYNEEQKSRPKITEQRRVLNAILASAFIKGYVSQLNTNAFYEFLQHLITTQNIQNEDLAKLFQICCRKKLFQRELDEDRLKLLVDVIKIDDIQKLINSFESELSEVVKECQEFRSREEKINFMNEVILSIPSSKFFEYFMKISSNIQKRKNLLKELINSQVEKRNDDVAHTKSAELKSIDITSEEHHVQPISNLGKQKIAFASKILLYCSLIMSSSENYLAQPVLLLKENNKKLK
ncbi:MAG: hypothetical protein QXO21_02760 [Candidatus Anstonellales archaeon]